MPVALLATALLASATFAALAVWVSSGEEAGFDFAIRNAIHGRASGPLTVAMHGVTQLGSTVFVILAGGAVLWSLIRRARPLGALWLVAGTLGGEILGQILKLLFHRARPDAFFVVQPISFSFPSTHAITACCFYGILAAILAPCRKSPAARAAVWLGAACLALAVGFSRIYLGVHYPTDVLAGYAAGIAWLAALPAVYRIRAYRKQARMKG